MKKRELESLAIGKLEDEMLEILEWEPDPESYGVQFGPGLGGAAKLLNKILEINPDYMLPDHRDDFLRYLKEEGSGKAKKLAESLYYKDQRMSFGKYKGKKLSDMPAQYIKWVLSNVELKEPLKTNLIKLYRDYEEQGCYRQTYRRTSDYSMDESWANEYDMYD